MLGRACLRDRRGFADARSALSDGGRDLALHQGALPLPLYLARSAGWLRGRRRGRVITIARASAGPIAPHGRAAVAHAPGERRGRCRLGVVVLDRVLVDGVGHWFHQIRAEEVNAKMGEWLGRLGILATPSNGEKRRNDVNTDMRTEERIISGVTA